MDLIEEDLEELRMLFHAEGDGIPLSEVQQMCSGVNDLLTVLQLDTEILIDNLKQVHLRCPPPASLSSFLSLALQSISRSSLHLLLSSLCHSLYRILHPREDLETALSTRIRRFCLPGSKVKSNHCAQSYKSLHSIPA